MDALALANTIAVARGRVVDGLDPELGLHSLREAIRELFDAAVTGGAPGKGAVEALNALARAPGCAGPPVRARRSRPRAPPPRPHEQPSS